MRYTIEDADGPMLASLPSGGTAAFLYELEEFALEAVLHAKRPDQWKVTPVRDDVQWLESLQARDVTHVYEKLATNQDAMHEISQTLLFARAKRASKGRQE